MKKKTFIFYFVILWVLLSALAIYFYFPIISSNFSYYFGKKPVTQENQKTEDTSKEQTKEEKKVFEPPKLLVPKINVDVPIVESSSIDEKDILKALENGVVRYPTTAKPGERGNVFIVGHSSNYRWAKGSYNYVFTNLNKLQKGDLITVYFEETKYVYRVFEILVVSPKEVSVLNQTEESIISLMTCDPPGTAWKRRVVKAIQIEPDPKTNKEREVKTNSGVQGLVGN